MSYKVYKFNIRMTADKDQLEQFLNSLHGEVGAIIPKVTMKAFWVHQVDFLLVVEKLN